MEREELEKLYDRKMVYHDKSDEGIGGRPGTVCVLWKGEHRYVGLSRCHSMDTFNRKVGHKIAYGRAVQALKEGLKLVPVRRADEPDRGWTAFKVYSMSVAVCIDVACGREEDDTDTYVVPAFLYKELKKEGA